MYSLNGTPVIEEDDQCFSCTYLNQGICCPLLEALGGGIAALQGETQVTNCGFYVPFERHLKLV